jgi:Spy/CpxP family protein refolding chaperone
MWKKTLVIGALAAAGIATLTGFRGGCGRPDHRDPAAVAGFVTDRVDDALDDLDATPGQRTAIHAVTDRVLARVLQHRGEHDADRAVLLGEWRSASPDRARLHALVDQRAAEMTAMAHEAVDAAIEVHATLTPEQREKVARKVERRAHR